MKRKSTWWRQGVLVLLALLVGTVAFLWVGPWLGHQPVTGVRIAGLELPRSGSLQAFLEEKARLWSEESLVVETGYHVWRPTRAELGAARPVDEMLDQLGAIGRSPNPLVAMGAWWRSAFGPGHDLRWRPRIVDETALDAYVERIRDEVDRPPTPGSFDPHGEPIEGLAGEALDVETTKRAIRQALVQGQSHVRVETLVTPPPRSSRRFANPVAEANVRMMRQETQYRPGNHGRATNIELAARKLHGHVIMPGATFSFNRVVGRRERSRGFAGATELINGEVVDGVGGGVCQVAGTLHAAAFFAGMIVEEQRPHSRLNRYAYLRPGLDTAVAWPDHVESVEDTLDLQLRNPYPFPVVIKTSTADESPYEATLRVDLYGAAKPFRVDWSFREIGSVPAGEKRRTTSDLLMGEEKVHQKGLDGIVIMRSRTIYMPTRRVEEEKRIAYPPTPRIVLVGSA